MSNTLKAPHPRLAGVESVYRQEILPWLQQQAGKTRRARIRWVILQVLALVVLGGIIWYFWEDLDFQEFGILGFLYLMYLMVTGGPNVKLHQGRKGEILEKICAHLGLELHGRLAGPAMFNFNQPGLNQLVGDYTLSDQSLNLIGTHAGLRFHVVECILTSGRGGEPNSHTRGVFDGRVFAVDFQSPLAQPIVLNRQNEIVYGLRRGHEEAGVKETEHFYVGPLILWSGDPGFLDDAIQRHLIDLVEFVEQEAKVDGLAWNEERIILTTKKGARNLLDYGDWWTNPTDPKILETILADFTYLFGIVERLADLKPIVRQKE